MVALALLCAGATASRAAVVNSDAIVVGEITSVEALGPPALVHIRVTRVLKGTLEDNSTIDLQRRDRLMPGARVVGVSGIWLLQAQPPKKAWTLTVYSVNCGHLQWCALRAPSASEAQSFAERAGISAARGPDRFAAELAAVAERLSEKDPGYYQNARILLIEASPTPGYLRILRQLRSSANPAARTIGSIGLIMQGDHELMDQIESLLPEAKTYKLELEMLDALRSRLDPDPRNVSAPRQTGYGAGYIHRNQARSGASSAVHPQPGNAAIPDQHARQPG